MKLARLRFIVLSALIFAAALGVTFYAGLRWDTIRPEHIKTAVFSVLMVAICIVTATAILVLRERLGRPGPDDPCPCSEFTAQVLFDAFRRRFPQLAHYLPTGKAESITIPGTNRALGDLVIYPSFDEITVSLADRVHCHFAVDWSHVEDLDRPDEGIVHDALQYVEDILADRVLVTLKCKRSHLLASSAVYLHEQGRIPSTWVLPISTKVLLLRLLPSRTRIERHLWSGPYSAHTQLRQ